MFSRTWTIVGLTLTLLIFGCSDADVAKVKAPLQHDTVGVAALPSRTTTNSNRIPSLPSGTELPDAKLPDAEFDEPLGIPQGFQPPNSDIPDNHSPSFNFSEVLLPVVKTSSKEGKESVQLLGFVDASGLKSLLLETGDLNVVRLADEALSAQVVAIEAPEVTLQQGDEQIELNLFELPGFHDPKTVFDVAGQKFGGQEVHGLGAPRVPEFSIGAIGSDGESQLPPLPGLHSIPETPITLPGFDPAGDPIDSEELIEQ
ncbi:MAG: hypothetical protein H8E66_13175 [Planctomycetes bacterium]|nr:hypothetical protein [Planctomycetota bacterium]